MCTPCIYSVCMHVRYSLSSFCVHVCSHLGPSLPPHTLQDSMELEPPLALQLTGIYIYVHVKVHVCITYKYNCVGLHHFYLWREGGRGSRGCELSDGNKLHWCPTSYPLHSSPIKSSTDTCTVYLSLLLK